MNGALPLEMLRRSGMTVMERQRALQQDQRFRPGLMCDELVHTQTKPDPGLENGWSDLFNVKIHLPGLVWGNGHGSSSIDAISTNSPTIAAADSRGTRNVSSVVGRESFKKRKAHHLQNTEVVVEDEMDKTKACAEEADSKATEGNRNKSCSSRKIVKKDTSEVEKGDYIHVRARRGQATDSHSLAERVRREKISERMKYLQGLVPGCEKITGKAGMLDEIINYVQSLQNQVEFLSMRLATVNPSLDFNNDNFLTKEIIHASSSSFQRCGILSEASSLAYLQMDATQQVGSSVPDAFLDSSCFTQTQPCTSWDVELQSLYSMAFDQGRAM